MKGSAVYLFPVARMKKCFNSPNRFEDDNA